METFHQDHPPEQPVPLTGLVGEETMGLSPAPPSTEGFRWPLPWPDALTGLEGCWSDVFPEVAAWSVPRCCKPREPGVWESGSCVGPPSRAPEAAWGGRGSAGAWKRRCELVLRWALWRVPWRDSEASSVGIPGSWLSPLVGTEFTWALLNSDSTLEVFKQRNLCDRLSATTPEATGTVVGVENCCLGI